jgi:hypothetical protein
MFIYNKNKIKYTFLQNISIKPILFAISDKYKIRLIGTIFFF